MLLWYRYLASVQALLLLPMCLLTEFQCCTGQLATFRFALRNNQSLCYQSSQLLIRIKPAAK